MNLVHYLAWSSKISSKTFEKYHIRSSFDVNIVDEEGRSVLHFATQRGNRDIIEYLCSAAAAGLDVDGRDHHCG